MNNRVNRNKAARLTYVVPESPILLALHRHIEVFASAARTLPRGSSELFSWGEHTAQRDERWVGTAAAQGRDVAALCAAASAIVDEMVRTKPELAEPAWLAWCETLGELNALVAAIGEGGQAPELRLPPRETLHRLPLPQELHWMMPDNARRPASVLQFMERMLAVPQAAGAPGEAPALALEVLLFAAACMATADDGQPTQPAEQDRAPALRAVERGHAWLIDHLPRRVAAA